MCVDCMSILRVQILAALLPVPPLRQSEYRRLDHDHEIPGSRSGGVARTRRTR